MSSVWFGKKSTRRLDEDTPTQNADHRDGDGDDEGDDHRASDAGAISYDGGWMVLCVRAADICVPGA